MEYYYTSKEKTDRENKVIVIDGLEFRHLVKVLRKKEGDNVTITDGEYNIFHCTITKINKDNLSCKINSEEFNRYEPDVKVKLYVSPLRNSSRFEFAIEKAVEVGVSEIVPVITDFTVNKTPLSNSKNGRLSKIIISAMGQSQRCFLPQLQSTVTFNEMIKNEKNNKNKMVMYELSSDKSSVQIDKNSEAVSLLIGPEGGFSKREISLLANDDWQIKSLGERKLRAETAVVISLFEIINPR